MPEHIGFQVSESNQGKQQQQTQQQIQHELKPATMSAAIGEFIVDDLKLFVSPVTAMVKEFRRQLKR